MKNVSLKSEYRTSCLRSQPTFRQLISHHLRTRPLLNHLASWSVIGIAMGLLLAPNLQATSIFSFGLAGLILASILSVVTYPLAERSYYILIGAAIGLVIGPFLIQFIDISTEDTQFAAVGMIFGSLCGATAKLWTLPYRLARSLVTGKSIFEIGHLKDGAH